MWFGEGGQHISLSLLEQSDSTAARSSQSEQSQHALEVQAQWARFKQLLPSATQLKATNVPCYTGGAKVQKQEAAATQNRIKIAEEAVRNYKRMRNAWGWGKRGARGEGGSPRSAALPASRHVLALVLNGCQLPVLRLQKFLVRSEGTSAAPAVHEIVCHGSTARSKTSHVSLSGQKRWHGVLLMTAALSYHHLDMQGWP